MNDTKTPQSSINDYKKRMNYDMWADIRTASPKQLDKIATKLTGIESEPKPQVFKGKGKSVYRDQYTGAKRTKK